MSEGFARRLVRALGGCAGLGVAAGVGWFWGRVSVNRPLPPPSPAGIAGVGRLTVPELFAAAASPRGVLVSEGAVVRGWSPNERELAVVVQAQAGVVGVRYTADGWDVSATAPGPDDLPFDGVYRWIGLAVERQESGFELRRRRRWPAVRFRRVASSG